jgi:predicted dinucleotide-binding enzyme
METIGILGTGRMGVRLARLLAERGHRVRLGSGDPARARRVAQAVDGGRIEGVTYAAAVAADAVLPAMFLRDGLLETLETFRDDLNGKIVIDITTTPGQADTLRHLIATTCARKRRGSHEPMRNQRPVQSSWKHVTA